MGAVGKGDREAERLGDWDMEGAKSERATQSFFFSTFFLLLLLLLCRHLRDVAEDIVDELQQSKRL